MGVAVFCGLIGFVIIGSYVLDKLGEKNSSSQNNRSDIRDSEEEEGFFEMAEEIYLKKERKSFQNSRRDNVYLGIEIQGTEDFVIRIKAVLRLLSRSESFMAIKSYLKCIRQETEDETSSASMMERTANIYIDEKSIFQPIWCANSIAHETYHIYVYQKHLSWKNIKEERECVEFSLQVLRELNTDDWRLMRYLEEARRVLLIRENNGLDFEDWDVIVELASKFAMER